MKRLIVTLLLVALTLTPSLATAQTTQAPAGVDQNTLLRDQADAAAAASAILTLAADRNFNAMYDSMHPDSMRVVPRGAAVGAFTDIYNVVQAGRAQITGVSMVPWTWPVTGTAYPYAAKVDFVQPYVDPSLGEQWLQDSMYLVQDNGKWRWFFGSSPEFVASAIKSYGNAPAAPAGGSILDGDLLANVVNDLDAYYADVLGYTPYKYRSPKVVIVEQGDNVRTACGPAATGFWAFYCPLDETIYLDEVLLTDLQKKGQGFSAAFVIAHEWAHHVQDAVGLERVGPFQRPSQWNQVYSIELELMADCMSGAWSQDLETRGMLPQGATDEVVAFSKVLGDPNFIGETDPQAHGTPAQRATAFMNGYQQGFLGCNIKI